MNVVFSLSDFTLLCIEMMRIKDNFIYNRLKTEAQVTFKKVEKTCKTLVYIGLRLISVLLKRR